MAKLSGTALKRALHELQREAASYLDSLSPAEQDIVNQHALSGYLWHPRETSSLLDLEEIIARGPRMPTDITVYRGGDRPLPERGRGRYPVQTSLRPKTAGGFTKSSLFHPGTLEAVELPEGSPGLYIQPMTSLPEEEILLPQGGEYLEWNLEDALEELREVVREFAPFHFDPDIRSYRFKAPYKSRGGRISGR